MMRVAEPLFSGPDFGLSRRLRWPRLFLYTLAVLSLLLLIWLCLAEVDMVVQTRGRIVPSARQQLIQHLEGGLVSQVMVKEGQRVDAGESLMTISALQANAAQDDRRVRLHAVSARLQRLQSEAEGKPYSDAVPNIPWLDPRLYEREAGQQRASFEARQQRLRDAQHVIAQQITQKQQEIDELQTRKTGLVRELDLARQQLQVVTRMHGREAASQLELLDARARQERLSTQLSEAESALPRLQSAVMELRARGSEALAAFRSDARIALAEAQLEQQRLLNELNVDDDRVQRTVVTAPVAGVVNKLLFTTVGGVVKPGEGLMEITPTGAPVYLETQAIPSDRGLLRTGLSATVKLSAFDFTQYGSLKARIEEISADSLADEKGERFFRVGLRLDDSSVAVFGQDLTPGLTLTADVIVGRRTVAQYLLSPLLGVTRNALRDTR